jgi:ABC-type antimicrobial peptide transport system permease subunit
MEVLSLIFSNLMRRRRSVFVIWIWIVVSSTIALLLASGSMGTERNALLQMQSLKDITHVDITSPYDNTGKSKLTSDAVEQLGAIPGVSLVVPVDYVFGEVSFGPYFSYPQLSGVGLDDISLLGYPVMEGDPKLGRGQIILGYEVPSQFYFRSRPDKQPNQGRLDLLGKVVKIGLIKYTSDGQEIHRSYSLRVTGVLKQTGSYTDYMSYVSIWDSERFKKWFEGQGFSRSHNGYDQLVVITNGLEDVETVQKTADSMGYLTVSRLSDIQSIRATAASLKSATLVVGIMAVLSCVIGIFLTTLNTMNERRSEIGLMMAVGATQQKILNIFMGETALIGLSGSVIGVLLALAIRRVLVSWAEHTAMQPGQMVLWGQDLANITFFMPMWLMVVVIVLISLFSLVGGILPAHRAAHLDPIQALRDT